MEQHIVIHTAMKLNVPLLLVFYESHCYNESMVTKHSLFNEYENFLLNGEITDDVQNFCLDIMAGRVCRLQPQSMKRVLYEKGGSKKTAT